jgi:hypothetical protein
MNDWSVTLNEERGFRVIENRALRRIFIPNSEDAGPTGWWRKLQNEDLYYLYSLPNVIRLIKSRCMRWAVHVTCMGAMKYWTQSICEPGLRHSKRGREDGKGKGEHDVSCAIAFLPSPYLSWLDTKRVHL